MDETTGQDRQDAERVTDEQRQDIAEVEERLDDQAEGDGLAAEAGRGEETGLAEG